MCSDATKRHEDALKWKNRWAYLMFALGLAMVGFLIAALVLILKDSLTEGIISGLGGLLSGGGFAWVLKRTKEATSEEKETYEDLVSEKKRLAQAQEKNARKERAKVSRRAFLGAKNVED